MSTGMIAVRRLGLGDEPLLELLAEQDASYDIEGRGGPRTPLNVADARAYLSDPDVLHWVAEDGGVAAGHLLCHVQRRRADGPLQVMLYEIGVRDGYRRRGVGRALIAAMGVVAATTFRFRDGSFVQHVILKRGVTGAIFAPSLRLDGRLGSGRFLPS
jgi:ribosomal protein S18 acetylase RimI-like enzyme